MKPSHEWFDELVKTSRRGLARYIGGFVTCPDDVQEILQEAYLKVFCALRRSGPVGHNPTGLLYTAARNIAISRIRHQNVVTRSESAIQISEELRSTPASTEKQASVSMRHRSLMLALNSLPPKCRSVFELRMIHGLSQQAIGERLGIAVSTVEKHLAAGLSLLKDRIAMEYGPAAEPDNGNAVAGPSVRRTGT